MALEPSTLTDMETERYFDFLSNLPPEVVLKITTYLRPRDVLRCMAVCRNWNGILSVREMAPFWRRACVYAGLPDYYVRDQINKSKFPSELFHQTRLHKGVVRTLTPQIEKITGQHPFESTTKCEYAGQGMFVKTVDFSCLSYEETVIGELSSDCKTIKKVDSMSGMYGQVSWAAVVAGNIVWQTQNSHWFRYDIQKHTFHKMLFSKVQLSMGDTIGYCRHCLFVVVASTENTMHGYSWILKFFRIHNNDDERPIENKIKVPIPPGITQFIPRPVKAHLIPDDDNCCSHRLIIQGGTGACVFQVTHTDGIKLSPKPVGTLNPFFDSDAAVMVVNTTSEMTLSQDEQLIGMVTSVVYPFNSGLCLHIFNVSDYKRIISVRVDWKDGFNDAEVLCLSKLYSVLGIGHSKGVVKVVQSRTGRIMLSRSGLSRGLPPVIPMARLLFVHYQGVFGDECMVDIRSPFTLLVLYRKGIGNIEGVFFHEFPDIPEIGYQVELEEESEDDRSA